MAGTKKISGKTYTQNSCHNNKTEAKSKAKKIRGTGKNARVVKGEDGKYCVYTRGRANKKK